MKIVRELRRHTAAVFRVDANCSWTVEQTIGNSRELKALGVEFIEQPLPAGDWEGMKRVFAESALPVMADESCLVEEDVPRCLGFFHGVNIKLVKCGGMTPARRMIAAARRLGLKVMMGCMTESTVGISAIAQFLPLLDYVDMDGAVLIARDVASGVRLEKGRAVFPQRKRQRRAALGSLVVHFTNNFRDRLVGWDQRACERRPTNHGVWSDQSCHLPTARCLGPPLHESLGLLQFTPPLGWQVLAGPVDEEVNRADAGTRQEACCVLDVPMDILKKAPGFDKDHWPEFADQHWNATVEEYYARTRRQPAGRVSRPNDHSRISKAATGI